jgi:hypothetical protein
VVLIELSNLYLLLGDMQQHLLQTLSWPATGAAAKTLIATVLSNGLITAAARKQL